MADQIPPDPAHALIRAEMVHWKETALTIQENTRRDMEQKMRAEWVRGFDDGFSAVDEAIHAFTTALREIAAMNVDNVDMSDAMASRASEVLAEWDAKRAHTKRYRAGRANAGEG